MFDLNDRLKTVRKWLVRDVSSRDRFWSVLRVFQTKANLFLESMADRVGSDIEQL